MRVPGIRLHYQLKNRLAAHLLAPPRRCRFVSGTDVIVDLPTSEAADHLLMAALMLAAPSEGTPHFVYDEQTR